MAKRDNKSIISLDDYYAVKVNSEPGKILEQYRQLDTTQREKVRDYIRMLLTVGKD